MQVGIPTAQQEYYLYSYRWFPKQNKEAKSYFINFRKRRKKIDNEADNANEIHF